MQYSVMEIARKIGVHPDTIWKAKRKRCASRKLAEMLEQATGICKFCFMDPDGSQFPDGWRNIGKPDECK